MKYWLMKTEPNTYSWQNLKKAKNKTTHWEGVRNYQARNYMRDEMGVGDKILFYHSVVKPMSIQGIAEICKEAYPDHFSWDTKSNYFDPKSSRENARWVMVDVKYVSDLTPPITLDELKETPGLEKMVLLQKGSRLSIQPVTAKEFEIIIKLRKAL